MRKILIRFDDICPTMDFERFLMADCILRKYKIKPLLGVIPDCRDPELMIDDYHEDFWDSIKALQGEGYSLAMHGYMHIYDSKRMGMVNTTFRSEFAGHPYEVQYERIHRGKEILISHGINTNIFFAPSHSYDKNTIKALRECGFLYMSDGLTWRNVVRDGITCIPCLYGGIPKMRKWGCYTAVFHAHEWKYHNKQAEFEKFCSFCETYKNDIVDFEMISKVRPGNFFIGLFQEKLNIGFRRYAKPILSYIKHSIFRL